MDLRDVGERIRTQDNRATAHPMFLVQEKKRIYGMILDYAEDTAWIHVAGDYEEADEEEAKKLCDAEDTDGWELVGYVDEWKFVTVFFTEQGAQDYIDSNKHNLNSPRIYAASAHRNDEFIAVRKMLSEQK